MEVRQVKRVAHEHLAHGFERSAQFHSALASTFTQIGEHNLAAQEQHIASVLTQHAHQESAHALEADPRCLPES
jgi:hypothetical protein